jgi:hypothetical protein
VIDKDGRRLLALRHGFGRTTTAPEDAQLLSKMRTNRQARAVLGVVAQYLRKGYDIAQTVPSFISPIDGTKMAAEAMRSNLDSDNRWSQKVYAAIPDNDDPVSDLNRKKVTIALTQARGTLTLVSSGAEDLNRGLMGSLADLLSEHLLPSWAQPSTGKGRDLALKIGIGVAVLIGLFVAGKLVHTIILGQSSALGEAEMMAMAIADAQRRKRHSRTVLSVS